MTTAAEWLIQAASVTAQDKADIVAGVFTQAQTTPIHSNIKQVNDITVKGVGTSGDPWNPI